jgi:hypothetical protein
MQAQDGPNELSTRILTYPTRIYIKGESEFDIVLQFLVYSTHMEAKSGIAGDKETSNEKEI